MDTLSKSKRTDKPQPILHDQKTDESLAKLGNGANINNHLMNGIFGEFNPGIQDNKIRVAEQENSFSMDRWSCLNCSKINYFQSD